MIGKKKAKLFGNHIDVKCEYCKNSSDYDGASVCKLNRSLLPDGTCPRFTYDPLRRAPQNLPPLGLHDPEEFKL